MDPRIQALVKQVARAKTVVASAPTYKEVHAHLASCFPGAEQFAGAFYNTMTKQHWQDRKRHPLTNWKAMARIYASRAHLRNL
jgi:hypothetical protein